MSEFWQGILIGLGLSVPVGIITNLVSTQIGVWLQRRNQSAVQQRAKEDASFEAQAMRFARNRSELYTYLLDALLRIAYYGAIFATLSGALFFLAYFAFDQLGFAAGQLIALIGTLIVMNIARPAVRMLRRVRDLSSPPAASASHTQTPAIPPTDPSPAPGSSTGGSSDAPQGNSAHPVQPQPSEQPPAS